MWDHEEEYVNQKDEVFPDMNELSCLECTICGNTMGFADTTRDRLGQPLYCSRKCIDEAISKNLLVTHGDQQNEEDDVPLVRFVNQMTSCRRESDGEMKAVAEDKEDDDNVTAAPAAAEDALEPILAEKKIWFLEDLELDPVFHSGGKYTITKSLSLCNHILHPRGKDGDELIWKVWFIMCNYHLTVELEPLEEMPEVNQVCFVDSASGLQRAVTTGTDAVNEYVAVKYLDFGGLDCVELKDCFHVCPRIMRELPIIALEVRMPEFGWILAGKQFSECLPMFKEIEVEVDMKDEIDTITWSADLIRYNGQSLIEQMCSISAPGEDWDHDD